ncbi:hypothetical protein WAI453_003042 [Rhynchosporium graminicola]|uniref:Trichothecene 3-O-acetyltransferase n=1 Tax=Rhynchosporium graminicola TaxID=2792576 RepID=A0A1E1LJD3_9HELO|nr:uncharacterized protein RCO7_11345 [Rhynchosporium commune]
MLPNSQLRFLSVWDRMASSEYVYIVLSFPLENNSVRNATAHLEDCLAKLSEDCPELAGDLITRESWMSARCFWNGDWREKNNEAVRRAAKRGYPFPPDTDPRCFAFIEDVPAPETDHQLILHQMKGQKIPFDVIHHEDDFGMTYEELKERGFPASAFAHPCFAFERAAGAEGMGKGIKPLRFVAVIINGGLLLSIHIHHILMDGGCMGMMFEHLSAITRKEEPMKMPSSTLISLPNPGPEFMQRLEATDSVQGKIRLCPECKMLPERSSLLNNTARSNQTSEPSTVQVFSFCNNQLSKLQDLMKSPCASKRPSKFACLSALIWAHTTKARLGAQRLSNSEGKESDREPAKLVFPVNWRKRAFQALTENYFGNACVLAESNIPLQHLLLAADHNEELAKVVQQVGRSIDAVDDEFVARRSAMMESLPGRCLGFTVDPRKPHNLSCNIWRHFSTDTVWDIPGVGRQKFHAIRRGLGQSKMGNAVILPGAAIADSQDVQISLPADAMDLLCRDEKWLQWVHSVIE